MDVILPSPRSTDDFVELARGREYQGRHFRKHILNLGNLIHPKTGQDIPLDDSFYSQLVKNFEDGVCDIVAVPLADAQNQHTEDPLKNLGEVMGISREGDKVYVDLDIRDPAAADKLGKTLLGTSAFLSLDYKDTRSGKRVGPTLLHACVTNRPYVTGLEDYQEVVAATADSESDVLVLAQEEAVPTKEELLAALKDEHGIDVEALQAAASERADVSQLTAALTSALTATGSVSLSAGDEQLTLTDVVNAVAEVAQKNVALSNDMAALRQERAADEVDGYIRAGRVLPKQRTAYIELALTNREMLEQLLPGEPLVALNHSDGIAPPQGEQRHVENIDEEVARLTAVANSLSGKK